MSLKKIIFICLGSLSLFMGIVGIFLPILPTTPFMLLSAFLYAQSSQRLYNFLITNKIFGKYLNNYKQGKGIPLNSKILSISLLWISIHYTTFFLIDLIYLKVLLSYIAIMVTVHIAGNKTYKKI